MKRLLVLLFALIALFALAPVRAGDVPPTVSNVLLIVMDDVGVDMVGCYGQANAPPTPNIDAIASSGMKFANAHVQCLCSPTRGCILTGRYGFRTGLGVVNHYNAGGFTMSFGEETIPQWLNHGTHTINTALIGKWHLSDATAIRAAKNPLQRGFDWYAGVYENFGSNMQPSYTDHTKIVNGAISLTTAYATTDEVDDTLTYISTHAEPWFIDLSFNAIHAPFHYPPSSLHTYTLSGTPNSNKPLFGRAMMQAMDTEIGRLLASIDPAILARTNIICIGDNGTEGGVTMSPFHATKAKGTLYEEGTHVPLMAMGPAVTDTNTTCNNLVSAVDIFPTVAKLLGFTPGATGHNGQTIDGVSFYTYLSNHNAAALRTYVYADHFDPNGVGLSRTLDDKMLRSLTYKLITHIAGGANDEFYAEATGTMFEGADLYPTLAGADLTAYNTMKSALAALVASP